MAKSAIRRHHIERLKHKRSHYYGGWGGSSPAVLGKMVKTPVPCSCYMCGNPRRHFGERTRQEILAAIKGDNYVRPTI